MKYKHKNREALFRYFVCLFSIITLMFVVATSNKKSVLVASNINTVKALTSSYFKLKESKIADINNSLTSEFNGTITGYIDKNFNCPINSELTNNIYYNDYMYGTVRILKTNFEINCGSVIKVSNYDNQEFIGIVLDNTNTEGDFSNIKLLFENEDAILNLETKDNISFKIERYGY